MYFIALHCNKKKLIETIIIIITIDDIHDNDCDDDDEDEKMRLLCDIIRSTWHYVYDIHIPGMTDMTDRLTHTHTQTATRPGTLTHTHTNRLSIT